MPSLALNAAAMAAGGLAAQLVFTSIEIVVARQLGSDAYGLFAFVYVITLTVALLVDMGVTWYVIDEGSRRPSAIPELIGTTIALKTGAYAIAYPIVLGTFWLFGYSEVTLLLLGVFLLYGALLLLQETLAAAHAARQTMHISALFQAFSPLLIAVLVGLSFLFERGLLGIGLAYVLGAALVSLSWLYLMTRGETVRVNLRAIPAILKGSYLYGISGLMSQALYKADILLLSLLTSMQTVGIYAAGYKLLDLAYKVPILGMRVVSPTLYKLRDTCRIEYAQVADAYFRCSLFFGLVLTIIGFLAASTLIELLFGDGFSDSADVLRLLSLSFVLKFVAGCLQAVLSTLGEHRRRTQALAFATVSIVLLQLGLIPSLGAMGAAGAVVIGEGLLCALLFLSIGDKTLRAPMGWRFLQGTTLAAAAIGGSSLTQLGGVMSAALSIFAFIGATWIVGLLRLDDLAVFTKRRRHPTNADS